MRALEGVRVLDLSRLLPGPAASAWLVGQGAHVDVVEPIAGDLSRHIPPFAGDEGALFAATAAGKRRMAIAMRHPEASAVLQALAPYYDVLIEGFRPGVLEALGLGEDARAQHYPRLVIARLSGYGQSGPWAQRPGHDLNYLATAGILDGFARDEAGCPTLPPVQMADMAGALAASAAICAALVGVARNGLGRSLDLSLAEAAAFLAAPALLADSVSDDVPEPGQGLLSGGYELYGTYACEDGGFIALAALEPHFRDKLVQVAGQDLSREALTALFKSRPREAWSELLGDACATPVLRVSELAQHPQWRARDAVRVREGGVFVRPVGGDWPQEEGLSHAIGAHTREILAEAGCDEATIDGWFARGVLA